MIDPKLFRDALGMFTTGVCVVTTIPNNDEPIGMTINSFASVSLDPPLILWSIQLTSDCYDRFDSSNKFAVSVLSHEQEHLSNFYAKKGDHYLDQGHYTIGSTGVPILNQAMAAFECKVWAKYPGGDHTIIVGEVMKFDALQDTRPLLFHCGKYGLMG